MGLTVRSLYVWGASFVYVFRPCCLAVYALVL